MGFINYFTTAAPEFGTLGWLFFLGQLLGVGAGAYLRFMYIERHPIRQTFLHQLGLGLMVLGGLGTLLAVLRLLNVPTMNLRIWSWLLFVIQLGAAGYVFYYVRNVLPNLIREARLAGVKPGKTGAPRALSGGAGAVPAEPRPVATTSRRDARRERKRKTR
ncbi:hypothetical protein [Candidatus Chloroploca asiatica]|uniref:Uncharacterized protein n=1 Tax=Candidatus Chloroploca asiatica TaxID=1506545 RepID=A0A2H3KVJ0_9CHLR|nr:hypothetical protein [Candidatus Chloroploca asiatica]PDV99353.1 hypothetical protein A9Q02_12695 [Candidatus Chloroploca asiatica]